VQIKRTSIFKFIPNNKPHAILNRILAPPWSYPNSEPLTINDAIDHRIDRGPAGDMFLTPLFDEANQPLLAK
jgi:hypothetical protein